MSTLSVFALMLDNSDFDEAETIIKYASKKVRRNGITSSRYVTAIYELRDWSSHEDLKHLLYRIIIEEKLLFIKPNAIWHAWVSGGGFIENIEIPPEMIHEMSNCITGDLTHIFQAMGHRIPITFTGYPDADSIKKITAKFNELINLKKANHVDSKL